MNLALVNLDNGLFLEKGRWTAQLDLADRFEELELVQKAVSDFKIRNAAAAMLSGNPLRASGFLWATTPKNG